MSTRMISIACGKHKTIQKKMKTQVVYYNYAGPFTKFYNTISLPNIAESLSDLKTRQPLSTGVDASFENAVIEKVRSELNDATPSEATFEHCTGDEYSYDFTCMGDTRSYTEKYEDKGCIL